MRNYFIIQQKFCEIKDKIGLYQNFSEFQECLGCKSKTHLIFECPLIHYIPIKSFIIARENFIHFQKRDSNFFRKKKKAQIKIQHQLIKSSADYFFGFDDTESEFPSFIHSDANYFEEDFIKDKTTEIYDEKNDIISNPNLDMIEINRFENEKETIENNPRNRRKSILKNDAKSPLLHINTKKRRITINEPPSLAQMKNSIPFKGDTTSLTMNKVSNFFLHDFEEGFNFNNYFQHNNKNLIVSKIKPKLKHYYSSIKEKYHKSRYKTESKFINLNFIKLIFF